MIAGSILDMAPVLRLAAILLTIDATARSRESDGLANIVTLNADTLGTVHRSLMKHARYVI
jgi:hypothetical protein